MVALLDRANLIGDSATEATTGPDDAADITLDADPEPGRKSRRRPRSASSSASSSASKRRGGGGRFTSRAQAQTEIADEIDMYLKLLAGAWSLSDQHCAPVLNEATANIARDAAALAARSEWVMERLHTTTLMADCFKLLHSTLPVLRAVYVHHVAGRHDDQEGGEVESVTVAEPYEPYQPYSPFRQAPTAA